MKRRISSLLVLTAAFGSAAGLTYGQNPPPWTPTIPKGDITIELATVVGPGELTAPVYATHAGDGSGRLFVLDQPGQIRIVTENGALLDTPFLDLVATGDVVTVNPGFDERGLLGLAFHPDYEENGRFFVRYSKARPGSPGEPCFGTSRGCHEAILAEFRVSNDPNVADPTTQRIVFRIDEPQFNHNGGNVSFGPPEGESDDDEEDDDEGDSSRRYLYFSLGDGGGANDGLADTPPSHGPDGNGLNNRTHLGAILRIDVDGGLPYAIPPDNPFAGGGCANGCDEIYAYGMRNPYRFSFDDKDGRLFLGEVGQNLYEEVDIVRKGGNYGWVRVEGFHCFDPFAPTSPPSVCSPVGLDGEPLLNPVAAYSHEDGIAVVGGFVYRGSQSPGLRGKYIFGDFSRTFFPAAGRLFWLDADGSLSDIFEFRLSPPFEPLERYVLGFGEDENGEVYVLTSQSLGPDPNNTTGEVFRIVGPGGDDDESEDEDEDEDDGRHWDLEAAGRSAGGLHHAAPNQGTDDGPGHAPQGDDRSERDVPAAQRRLQSRSTSGADRR